MAKVVVDNVVNTHVPTTRVELLVRQMSTMDLALSLALLSREYRSCLAEGAELSARRCGERMELVEKELHGRQMRLDELLG